MLCWQLLANQTMNINLHLPANSVDFLLAILPVCVGLISFILGVSLGKKHFGKYLIQDLEDDN